MISKEEYKWLERHTDILNIVPNIDDYAHEFVKFKVYRPSHIQKIKEIFKNYKCTSGQNKKDIWIKIKGFTLDNLNETAYQHFGDMIYDCSDHGIYFMPTNKRRNQRILRKASPRLLENLSNRKKLDILFSYAQTIFPTEQQRLHQNEFIDQNSEKFQALLQLKISPRFMENEYQKVRQIVSEIASLPDIKNKLENFHSLPEKEQRFILSETSRITAKVNGVKPPKIHYLSQKQINNDEQVAEWTQADAYADYNDIYLNKDFLKKYNGIKANGAYLFGATVDDELDIIDCNEHMSKPEGTLLLGYNDFDLLVFNFLEKQYQIVDREDMEVLDSYPETEIDYALAQIFNV